MILWKISTAISIKHRILATFNIKQNQSERLYAFKYSCNLNEKRQIQISYFLLDNYGGWLRPCEKKILFCSLNILSCSHNLLFCSHNILSCSHNLLFCSHKKDILFPQHIILFPQYIILFPQHIILFPQYKILFPQLINLFPIQDGHTAGKTV